MEIRLCTHPEWKIDATPLFLTNNTKGFGQQGQDKKHMLHLELAAQIPDPTQLPILMTALKEARGSIIAPKLEGMTVADLPDLSHEMIRETTTRFLLDDLPIRTIFGIEDLPFSNEVTIDMVGEDTISEILFTKANDQVVIKVAGSVELEATGFMEKFMYYHGLERSRDACRGVD